MENTSGDMRMPSDIKLVYITGTQKFHPNVKNKHKCLMWNANQTTFISSIPRFIREN